MPAGLAGARHANGCLEGVVIIGRPGAVFVGARQKDTGVRARLLDAARPGRCEAGAFGWACRREVPGSVSGALRAQRRVNVEAAGAEGPASCIVAACKAEETGTVVLANGTSEPRGWVQGVVQDRPKLHRWRQGEGRGSG